MNITTVSTREFNQDCRFFSLQDAPRRCLHRRSASSIYLKPEHSPKMATSQSPEVPPPLDYSTQFLPHVRAQWNVQSTSLNQSHPFRGS